ncbi:MAG: right-handed parallel beta-helix repeat-containing protein [Richelia sp. SL_2_1]|nr:right-handed parallel beta-helix repeat-containing protein [Richelia sp. SL_2_1]
MISQKSRIVKLEIYLFLFKDNITLIIKNYILIINLVKVICFMFLRQLCLSAFILTGLYGCFGDKTNSVAMMTVAQSQKDFSVSNNSQKVLTFAKPKKVIYVAVNGNNKTGDGTSKKPFLTLNKAFKVAERNTLIKMGEGNFEVKGMITVPSHVSLEGVGKKTVITPGKNYQGVLFEAKDFNNEKGDGYQYFRNFNVDGKDKSELGFRAWGRENSLFENITFVNFNNAGIDISGLNNEISNCRFINASGREGQKNEHFSGAIKFMSANGLLIHDNYIEENSGGGIKSVASNIRNTQIYNNTINLKAGKNQKPNKSASIEIWDLKEGNKIYNNNLNGWVSLINQWDKDQEIPPKGNLLFYKNKLQANPGITDDMSGLELGIKGAEFYENTFSGFKHRIFWIEGWGGKKKPTKDIIIHNNQFNNCGNAMNLGPNGNGVENLKFYDNVIQNCNGVVMGIGGEKKLINISVTDNIFVNSQKAITLHGQSKQYVNLRIAENKAYASKFGLDNKVDGLNVSGTNPVSLKKGLPATKGFNN